MAVSVITTTLHNATATSSAGRKWVYLHPGLPCLARVSFMNMLWTGEREAAAESVDLESGNSGAANRGVHLVIILRRAPGRPSVLSSHRIRTPGTYQVPSRLSEASHPASPPTRIVRSAFLSFRFSLFSFLFVSHGSFTPGSRFEATGRPFVRW